jgi:hypothetical protein
MKLVDRKLNRDLLTINWQMGRVNGREVRQRFFTEPKDTIHEMICKASGQLTASSYPCVCKLGRVEDRLGMALARCCRLDGMTLVLKKNDGNGVIL